MQFRVQCTSAGRQVAIVIKWGKLICKVSAHSLFFYLLHTAQIIIQFLGCDRPTESIQSAQRKLEGQNLITEKHRSMTLVNHFKMEGHSCGVFSKCTVFNDH